METLEEQALRMLKVDFVKRLDVGDYVLDYLEQEQALSDLKCERIRDTLKTSRLDAAQATIDAVLKKSVVPVFLNALWCGNSHPYLAKLLSDKVDELKQEKLALTTHQGTSVSNALPQGQTVCQSSSFSQSHSLPQIVSPRQPDPPSQSFPQRQICSESQKFPQSDFSTGNRSISQRKYFQNENFQHQSSSEIQTLLKGSTFSFGSTSCGTDSSTIYERRSKHSDPDETSVMKLESDGGGRCTGTNKKHEEDAHGEVEGVSRISNVRNEPLRASNIASRPFEDEDDDKEETDQNPLVIHQQPNKVDVMDKKKRTLTKIHYHLKLLSHDGQKEKFEIFVCKYKKRFRYDPDILFTLLDAEVESRRLVYDEGLHGGDIFNEMQACIDSSSHPLASTVMFLARKGSARTMKESLEVGLYMLEEARALTEQIKPCKDTGMVLYILINILFQMYEKRPCLKLKERIIRTIDEAINDHFAESPPFLREDYKRMLFLKMVFCYLGIGLFGNTIKDCVVSVADIRAAKECLEIIDKSKAHFDNRREMFYSMAQSVLCTKLGKHKEALRHAETAKRKAEVCGFKKELGPIQELTGVLERTVEEQNERVSEEREQEIEADLEELERQRELTIVRNVLRKPCNQWGEPH